jgi:hypothetical protein
MAVLSTLTGEIYIRFGIYIVAQTGSGCFLCLGNSDQANIACFTRKSDTKKLEYRYSTVSAGVTADGGALELNQWHCIEVHAKIAASPNGIMQVKIDGSQVIDYSGNTKYGNDAGVKSVEFGFWVATTNLEAYFDDLAINDTAGAVNNSWIGQGGILGLKPVANGYYAQLTPSAGSNFECVNHVPPDDVHHVASATVDKKDSYEMQDMPAISTTINAIRWEARVRATESSASKVARLLRIGGSDYQGSDIPIDVSTEVVSEVLETNPATSTIWTVSTLNSTEAGVVVK